MNISDVLIEKYHQGLCSAEEKLAVEKWLEDGDEQPFEFPAEVSVETIKSDVWQQVKPDLQGNIRPLQKSLSWKYAGAAAAVLMVLIAGGRYLQDQKNNAFTKNAVSAAGLVSQPAQTETLKIEFGAESGAVYSKENQMLDFCGTIKITPKENMKLSFTSVCDGNRETIKEIEVKGGSTYFAMDLKDQNRSELVIMDENLVGELPPILQNSLIAQFGI